MFAFTLKTLVLRGVVRTGELGVARLGFGVKAGSWSPGNANSVSPCPCGMRPDTSPLTPKVGYPIQSVSSGAGRSRRHAEASVRESIATAVCGRQLFGGLAAAAAAIQPLGRNVATVGEVNPRLAILAVSTEGRPACSH